MQSKQHIRMPALPNSVAPLLIEYLFTLHSLQALYSICYSAMIRSNPSMGGVTTNCNDTILLSSPPHPESSYYTVLVWRLELRFHPAALLSASCCMHRRPGLLVLWQGFKSRLNSQIRVFSRINSILSFVQRRLRPKLSPVQGQ